MKGCKHETTNQIPLKNFMSGIDAFNLRLGRQKALYTELWLHAASQPECGIIRVSDSVLFKAALSTFGPVLCADARSEILEQLYDVAFDRQSGALIIANKGATLWCLSPKSETPYLARHIGLSIYLPGLGLETVNVALVGDVYDGRIFCRAESACAPSFLFGSQRCNCSHQWDSFREIAARFNPCDEPSLDRQQFEAWVNAQCESREGRHVFRQKGAGFVFIHLDSQNGMGSGATRGEFCMDLFNRASLRHRGEYSAEQILSTTMAGGFRAIGLEPDPRGQDEGLGYMVAPIVLDFLGTSREIVVLSNNKNKLRELRKRGFRIQRLKTLGAVNTAGALEAEQRGTEFGHLDIDAQPVTFAEEMERLEQEIARLSAFRQRDDNFEVQRDIARKEGRICGSKFAA